MQQCFFCVYITARFHVKECIVKKQASRRNAEERTPLLHYAFSVHFLVNAVPHDMFGFCLSLIMQIIFGYELYLYIEMLRI